MPIPAALVAALPAIVSSVPALAQTGVGIAQRIKGKKIAEEAGDRPEYEIPLEVLQALEGMRTLASQTRLPGQSSIESQLRASAATTAGRMTEGAGSSAELLGALSQAGLGEQQGMLNIGIKSAEMQDRRTADLINMLKSMGQYRDKEFMMNEMQPWQDAMKVSSGLRGQGMQNIFAGVSDIAGIGLNAVTTAQMGDISGILDKLKKYLDESKEGDGEGKDDSGSLGIETDPSLTSSSLNPSYTPVKSSDNQSWAEGLLDLNK